MISFLFSPQGRVSRADMWGKYLAPQVFFTFLAGTLDAMVLGSATLKGTGPSVPPMGFGMVVALFYIWPSIAVPIKRYHDRGMTGWWVLFFALGYVVAGVLAFAGLVQAIGSGGKDMGGGAILGVVLLFAVALAQFIILFCLPGDDGDNRFGSDPRNGRGSASSTDAGEGGASAWSQNALSRVQAVGATAGAADVVVEDVSSARRSNAAPGSGSGGFGRRVR